MRELVAGGNAVLPRGALSIEVPGPFDVSVLITAEDGKVGGDADFVFFNQPTAPGVRLDGTGVRLDPSALRPGAAGVTVVISAADGATELARLPVPSLWAAGPDGRRFLRFTPEGLGRAEQPGEAGRSGRPGPGAALTVVLLAEIYRRGDGWKIRALGQGYADGLAGVARDFGVEVADDGAGDTVSGADAQGPRTASGAGPPGAAGASGAVNGRRARAGVPPVVEEPRLTEAARAHAGTMAAQGGLAVESPDGTSVYQRAARLGYGSLVVAEDLVSGPRTEEEFIDYLVSGRGPGRAPALLDPAYRDVGIASVTDARSGDVFWTALWGVPLTPDALRRTTADIVTLTNAERTAAGLRPLADDGSLARAAQDHSADMVTRVFYAHTSPEGREPWDRAVAAGAAHRAIGENIACGQRSSAEVVQGWMNSPGHRANILKPDFTHIGTGVAGGGRAGTYWTQVFGTAR